MPHILPEVQASNPGNRSPRLLIVDDDPVNREVLGSIFEDDHEVTLLDGAGPALEACRVAPPDLVLMDVVMPDLDGLEACRRLKADPLTRDIPVIFITSLHAPREEIQGLEAGAEDFITKPVNPAVVRARVRTHLLLASQAQRLRALALQDGLTGLANRRHLDATLVAEWRRCQRSGLPIAMLMMDLDHFKRFNDAYGHPAGDACLRAVGQVLMQQAKRPHDVAARYGGEEFVCLLPETDPEGARSVADAILHAVRELAIPHRDNGPGIVTLSAGIAVAVPDLQTEPASLAAEADARLYEAKAAGRNRRAG